MCLSVKKILTLGQEMLLTFLSSKQNFPTTWGPGQGGGRQGSKGGKYWGEGDPTGILRPCCSMIISIV